MARNQSLVAVAFAAVAYSSGSPATSEGFGGYLKDQRAVSVSLRTFRIEPELLHIRAGRPIVLRVSNDSGMPHDLTAPEFFARAAIAPADRAKVTNGRIAVGANRSVAVMMTPRSGRYRIKCSHPLHKMLGMAGIILVDP